ncbi:hypothetical protein [Catellatospora paridis]|uniref:hypothetical protein n=1 Tax=Catellatospora paridis TaxID=1617086 RepID=UPI0012D450E2|nr:hypothetical protein [Catellatospora paridis]
MARIPHHTTELERSNEGSGLAPPPDHGHWFPPDERDTDIRSEQHDPGFGRQADSTETGPQPFSLAQAFEPAEVVHGALRGAIAAMAMSGLRRFTVEMGWAGQPPPDAIVKQKTPGLVRGKTTGERRAMIELCHWGYGAVGGAGFALLPRRIRRRAWSGPVFGLLLWAGYETVVAPVLGIARRPGAKLSQRLSLAADHLLYGFVLSHTRRRPPR